MKFSIAILMLLVLTGSSVYAQSDGDINAIKKTLESWNQGWEKKDAATAVEDYAEDVDWTNAFGDRFQGRDELKKGLEFIFSLDFVMAGSSGNNEFEDVTFLTPDIAMLRSKLVRTGQQTSAGEVMPDRQIHHLRVLQRREGKWKIVSHLISQAHEKGTNASQNKKITPNDEMKGKGATKNDRLSIIDVHAHVYVEDERWNYKVPDP